MFRFCAFRGQPSGPSGTSSSVCPGPLARGDHHTVGQHSKTMSDHREQTARSLSPAFRPYQRLAFQPIHLRGYSTTTTSAALPYNTNALGTPLGGGHRLLQLGGGPVPQLNVGPLAGAAAGPPAAQNTSLERDVSGGPQPPVVPTSMKLLVKNVTEKGEESSDQNASAQQMIQSAAAAGGDHVLPSDQQHHTRRRSLRPHKM